MVSSYLCSPLVPNANARLEAGNGLRRVVSFFEQSPKRAAKNRIIQRAKLGKRNLSQVEQRRLFIGNNVFHRMQPPGGRDRCADLRVPGQES